MIRRVILKLLKTDIKFIVRHQMLLMAISTSFILILFLRLVFPLLSDFIFAKTTFQPYNYYTITAITLVSVIPMLFGMVYAFIFLDKNDMHMPQVIAETIAGKKKILYMRMIVQAFLSFIMVLFTILLTHPVTSEGWLRTVYISFLMSIQSPFVFLFICSLSGNKAEGRVLSMLYSIFLIAVPLGLLLHSPWNYFAFFSPLYWISWAWVISVPAESFVYGSISMIITAGCILIFFRHLLKKHKI